MNKNINFMFYVLGCFGGKIANIPQVKFLLCKIETIITLLFVMLQHHML